MFLKGSLLRKKTYMICQPYIAFPKIMTPNFQQIPVRCQRWSVRCQRWLREELPSLPSLSLPLQPSDLPPTPPSSPLLSGCSTSWGAKWVVMAAHLVGAGNARLPAWPPRHLQLAGYLHPSAQSPPATWIFTASAWTMVAVRGYCMIRVAEWRNSSSYIKHSLCLLPQSRPLLSLTSMDAQQVKGGKQRRDVWAERRRNRSQPRLHTLSMENNNISRPATANIATTPVATSPFPLALPASPSQLASAPLTVSPQPAPPPRKRAKTCSEAIRASSRDVVWEKKANTTNRRLLLTTFASIAIATEPACYRIRC